jgi:hypothetical protein
VLKPNTKFRLVSVGIPQDRAAEPSIVAKQFPPCKSDMKLAPISVMVLKNCPETGSIEEMTGEETMCNGVFGTMTDMPESMKATFTVDAVPGNIEASVSSCSTTTNSVTLTYTHDVARVLSPGNCPISAVQSNPEMKLLPMTVIMPVA